MSEYQPIACHLHDEYEIAIMRKQSLDVELSIEGGWQRMTIYPVDLKVEDKEEYLIYRQAGVSDLLRVRLDRVRVVSV